MLQKRILSPIFRVSLFLGSKYFFQKDKIRKSQNKIVYNKKLFYICNIEIYLVEVAERPQISLIQTRIKTGSEGDYEWPSGDESWWQCTGMCYDYAMNACRSDDVPGEFSCLDACEIANGLAWPVPACEAAVASFCALYCI